METDSVWKGRIKRDNGVLTIDVSEPFSVLTDDARAIICSVSPGPSVKLD